MPRDAIQLGKGLGLPLETVTQSISILARKRAGKSYLARRFAEQLVLGGQQIIIVDPKGDWWGIRSAADGKSPGLSVVILGGERGDVKLEAGGGEVVARLVVEERVSVLLDLSLFRKHEVSTFMAAFLESLYRLKALEKNRTPCMLLVDEADAIAPQKPQHGEERMLGAIDDVVRRGGQRGLGCTLISQRSAVLNKNVLTQTQILIALRTISPQDLKALEAWIDVHGDPEQRKTLMGSLPSLPTGDSWVWSPGWPTDAGIFQRTHTLPIETFDSGATPKPGEKRVEPRKVAEIDLAAVSRQMAETIERAKADDPKVLRARIAELEKDLRKSEEARIRGATMVEFVDRPVFDAQAVHEIHEQAFWLLDEASSHLTKAKTTIGQSLVSYRNACQSAVALGERGVSRAVPIVHRDPKPEKAVKLAPVRTAKSNGAGANLPKVERLILTVLAQQHPKPVSRERLALLVGYHANSKGFVNGLGALRGRRSVDGTTITEGGFRELGHYEELPTGSDLLEWYCEEKLTPAEGRILRAVADGHGRLSREELASAVDYHPNAKSFVNGIGRLRGLGLVDGLRLSPDLED